MVAPVPAHISNLPRRKLSCPSRRSGPNSRPVNLLQPLRSLFAIPILYFQQFAASFHKTPGWGVPRFSFQPPTARYPLLTTHSPLTTFRINTCKSVSKQRTLTTFRMNTYAKQGEGGTQHFRLSVKGDCIPAAAFFHFRAPTRDRIPATAFPGEVPGRCTLP